MQGDSGYVIQDSGIRAPQPPHYWGAFGPGLTVAPRIGDRGGDPYLNEPLNPDS
jgi:hypothetical protein